MCINNNTRKSISQETNNNTIENNITKQIIVQGVKTEKIRKDKKVKATVQGEKYIDILDKRRDYGTTMVKLNKKQYCVPRTGEIREFKPSLDNRKTNGDLRKTFTRLRQLIRTNFTEESSNQLFITLTYRENMMDTKKLYNDFEDFYKRLKYKLKKHKLEYIVVMEPQGRGAWHAHVMLKSDQPVLYIENEKMAEIWGFGDTKTERLKSDEVGSYYVAYFTDVLEGGEAEEMKPASERDSKKKIKGGRLSYYPKNFKFYRTSRGIKKPEKLDIEYQELEKKGYKKVYENAIVIAERKQENGKKKMVRELNKIQRETWRKD